MDINPNDIEALRAEQATFGLDERQMAERMLREHLIPAVHTVCHLATYADRDNIKFAAAQYVVERNLGMLREVSPLVAVDDDALLKLVNAWADKLSGSGV